MDIDTFLDEQQKLINSYSSEFDENAFKNLTLTVEEKQIILTTLELEMETRILKLKQKAEELSANLLLRSQLEIAKLPKEIRQLPLSDFINIYHSDPREYFEKQVAKKVKEYDDQLTPLMESKKRKWTLHNLRRQDDETDILTEDEGLPKKRPARIPRSPMLRRNIKEDTNILSSSIIRQKSSFANGSIFQVTESQSKFNPELPPAAKSVMRRLLPGEIIFSINGSPLINPFSKND
ncbi:16622_t:CDS:2 [Dentiscutata erythropus]|uniref:16622_t:CDS:1 n=1 Tax=Dentiscutata erythropus TaxID=1348616 RepID=A0A9N9P6M8_9GLOM|nr:16622_t:CDS:2 [Dentiscutata erythropus]